MNTLKIAALILILVSCKTRYSQQPETFQTILPDSARTYKPELKVEKLRVISQQLKLRELTKGVDSFNFRMWQTSMMTRNSVVDISFVRKKWLSTVTDFYETENQVHSFKTQEYSSKITSTLIDSILSYDFIHIPSQYDIPNFQDKMNDGVTLTIEISSKKYYKLLIYHCPNRYPTDSTNMKIMELINLLDNHFHFYDPLC